jgi:hypothetical protein
MYTERAHCPLKGDECLADAVLARMFFGSEQVGQLFAFSNSNPR